MSNTKTMKQCRKCKHKERDGHGIYCEITCRNCSEYPEKGECVNFEPKESLCD